ncbi:MAG: hypothetical protein AAFU57_02020 [Bacteroidota bacterium]
MKTIACNPIETCSPPHNEGTWRSKWLSFWNSLTICGAEDLSKIK